MHPAHRQHLIAVARSVVLYNAFVFALMTTLYSLIGFRRHFEAPSDGPLATHVLYFSAMTHSMIGCPDVYPRTPLARALVSVHAVLVFLQIGGMLLFASTVHTVQNIY